MSGFVGAARINRVGQRLQHRREHPTKRSNVRHHDRSGRHRRDRVRNRYRQSQKVFRGFGVPLVGRGMVGFFFIWDVSLRHCYFNLHTP